MPPTDPWVQIWWALLAVAVIVGGLVGSFLNVVAWRLPNGRSIVSPPSACPCCGRQIRPWHNVPVFGWLILAGRCADCRSPIPARYPLVEAACEDPRGAGRLPRPPVLPAHYSSSVPRRRGFWGREPPWGGGMCMFRLDGHFSLQAACGGSGGFTQLP